MHLTRRMKLQFIFFTIVALISGTVIAIGFVRVPAMFGIGRYTVTVELPRSGGLYATGNVTYRGVEVGRIANVGLTETGVAAVLSLRSGIAIPADITAEVHSQSAVGEQYVALIPRSGSGPALKDGDVITSDRATVPPPIDVLLDDANKGLEAIPQGNLKTAVDESYVAFGGLGPEISRIVKGATSLAIEARNNLDAITALIDQSAPVLDSQTATADSIQAWASHTATVAGQLQAQDRAVSGVIAKGGPAADESRQLLERIQPTLPVILANLSSIGKVAIAYQPALEQLLVMVPQVVAVEGAIAVPNSQLPPKYRGLYLSFNLNLNLPPVCATGYLPPQQVRSPALIDYPDRTGDNLYCRVPQDTNLTAVRGVRNLPCLTVPGKRAPTVEMCESNDQYVPLNDGYNWKGDPNATLSGQDIPQPPPAATATAPALAVTPYDPATGSYVGPDGKVYTQSDMAATGKSPTWETMLVPDGN